MISLFHLMQMYDSGQDDSDGADAGRDFGAGDMQVKCVACDGRFSVSARGYKAMRIVCTGFQPAV